MSAPAVTVLMGVYNNELFVREAIDSILAQSCRDFELLVVDDGSTDATAAILASYDDRRLRVLRNERNVGLTRSLNRGLRVARGALIARQDADDMSSPERLARQVAFLESHPDVVVLGTQFVSLDAWRHRLMTLWMRCETPLGIRWQLLFENPFVHSSVMFRRDVIVDHYGGYDERFRTNQDIELWSRIAPEHRLRNLPEALVTLRHRSASVSGSYGRETVLKVADVTIANRRLTLGPELAGDMGIEVLTHALNPRLFPSVQSLRPVAELIEQSYDRFVELWPEARHIGEVRRLAASLMVRAATMCAARSPVAMSRWFMEATRYHLPTVAGGALPFAAMSGVGLWRRNFGVAPRAREME
jgi:glycosyl transferase family 2